MIPLHPTSFAFFNTRYHAVKTRWVAHDVVLNACFGASMIVFSVFAVAPPDECAVLVAELADHASA